ncbi:MAG TPA: amidohydrolase family protein [Chloroflexota bacterium]|nr:amidohydrolase family protein [Chloroflexota bacterium]
MIDFHQHIGHMGRTVEQTLAHQVPHGVTQSVILPIDGTSTPAERFSTEAALDAARRYPQRLIPFCHVDPLRPDALEVIRRAHAAGARGFGEHKVRLPVDAPQSQAIYRLCGELGLPVLLHFEYGNYNHNFEAFADVLQAHPETVFIGHAQAWWANISAEVPRDPQAPGYTAYPRGKVVPGGLTDRWLETFPNLYGDLSAGSGLGALSRDPDFTRDFLRRHQTKLLWATDCPCRDGAGDWGEGRHRQCFAAQTLPLLRELAPSPEAFQRITRGNAATLLRLP